LGVFFNFMAENFSSFETVRFPGVLQRIGLCNLIVTPLFLLVPPLVQRFVVISLVAVYLGLMYGWNVPGCGIGVITPHCNAGGYIDRLVLGDNMSHPNDSEGILSTCTSVATTYLGLEFGRILSNYKSQHKRIILSWGIMSIISTVISIILQFWIPYNKKIWSISFVFITAGLAGASLTLCYVIVDFIQWRGKSIVNTIVQPFVWLGMNPLAIFSMMIFVGVILMDNIKFYFNGSTVSLWSWIYLQIFNPWLPGMVASLTISILWLLFWILIAWIMYKKEIFIKL